MRIATWISYALQIEVLVGSRSPLRQLTRDRLRLSRSVAREKMRPIVISPLPPMIKANVRAAPIEAPSDQYPRHTDGRRLLRRGPRALSTKSATGSDGTSPIAVSRSTRGRSSCPTYRQQPRRNGRPKSSSALAGIPLVRITTNTAPKKATRSPDGRFFPDPAWVEAMAWVRQHTDPADAEADRAIREWICRRAAAQKPRRPRKEPRIASG